MCDNVLASLGLDPQKARDFVQCALEEDLQWGADVTSLATLPRAKIGRAHV